MIIAREITAGTSNAEELFATATSSPKVYEIKLLANDSVNTITVSFEGSTATSANNIILKAGEKLENLEVENITSINYLASAASSKFRVIGVAR